MRGWGGSSFLSITENLDAAGERRGARYVPGWQGEGVAAWPWALPRHTGWWEDRPQYMGSREVKEGACV